MKNKVWIVMLIGITIFISNSCAQKTRQQSADRSKITVLSIGDERILGPHWDSPPRFLVFLPLVEHSHAEPKPALAERWEHSPDYKTWTFYLRRDVRWHDGVTTTAHDIKFTLDLMDKLAKLKQIQGIVSYDVIDDFTFTITYKKSSMYALDYWSVYWPKHLLEDLDTKNNKKWEYWTQPDGNGPYRYVRHPGYVGIIAFGLATPLMLGTLWAFIPALFMLCISVVRTALEDRTLKEELEGYKDYAEHVRYRLLPGIW